MAAKPEIVTWTWIRQNWGDILQEFRVKLTGEPFWQFDADGKRLPSQRAMLEDAVCCYASYDTRLLFYMQEAGMQVTLSGDRPPRIINVGAKHQLPIGQGGRGVK